jgi:hypothetical protein
MNVFQSLGHPFIPFNYIRILGCAAWWNNMKKWTTHQWWLNMTKYYTDLTH